MVVLRPGFAALDGNQVDGVRLVRTFDELELADPFDIVVLDPLLLPAVNTYRFDLALGRLEHGAAAVLGGEPSMTAERTALSNGVALGTLAPGVDFSSLLLLVRDLVRGRQERDVTVLESVCQLCDATSTAAGLDNLLAAASKLLGTTIEVRSAPAAESSEVIRLVGAPTRHLVDVEVGASPVESSLGRAARSYLARRVEQLLQAEIDSQPPGVVPANDLVNEILLDEVDNSGAAQRLRRTGFPIDGSHTAIRIDCHDHSDPGVAPMTNRMRQQVRDAALAAVSTGSGQWTCTGTPASIVLVASQSAAGGHAGPLDISRSAQRVVSAVERLGALVRIGVGTRQVGVDGLRATVSEATIAMRSAVDSASHNEPHYFDRLGVGRALMQWAEIDWVKPVVNETLAPLLSLPPERRRESVRTLRTYLDTGRSVGETARRLHMHRNSVRYRIARIEDALDIDLDHPDERLFIELGCRLFLNED